MLPGFRFLISTVLLSVSVVVFGLGASALLRAAREDLVSRPLSWEAPEAVVARERDTRKLTLAMLRVETIADQDSNVERMIAVARAAEQAAASTADVAAMPPVPEAAATAEVAAMAPAETSRPAPGPGTPVSVAAVEPAAAGVAEVPVSLPPSSPRTTVQAAPADVTVVALSDPAAASAEVATTASARGENAAVNKPGRKAEAGPAAKPAASRPAKSRADAGKRERARHAAALRRRVVQQGVSLQPRMAQPGNPFAGFGG